PLTFRIGKRHVVGIRTNPQHPRPRRTRRIIAATAKLRAGSSCQEKQSNDRVTEEQTHTVSLPSASPAANLSSHWQIQSRPFHRAHPDHPTPPPPPIHPRRSGSPHTAFHPAPCT